MGVTTELRVPGNDSLQACPLAGADGTALCGGPGLRIRPVASRTPRIRDSACASSKRDSGMRFFPLPLHPI
jgi:hypothetical protein